MDRKYLYILSTLLVITCLVIILCQGGNTPTLAGGANIETPTSIMLQFEYSPIQPSNVFLIDQVFFVKRDTALTSVQFKPNEDFVAYGTTDGIVYLSRVDGNSSVEFRSYPETITDISFSPDGELIAFSGPNREVSFLETRTLQWVRTFADGYSTLTVEFDPHDKNIVAFGGEGDRDKSDFQLTSGGGYVSLWQLDLYDPANPLILELDELQGIVHSISFSPDGSLIAAGISSQNPMSEKGWVSIWDRAGLEIAVFETDSDITSVSFSPDGKQIASAMGDGTIILWSIDSSEKKFTFEGHTKKVSNIIFNADGTLLVSGAEDGTLRFWDTLTGEELRTLSLDKGEANPVSQIAFNSGGTLLASTSRDGILRIWAVQRQ